MESITVAVATNSWVHYHLVKRQQHRTMYIFLTNIIMDLVKKVNQSHYRPEVPRGFQEVKVPRLCDSGPNNDLGVP